MDIEVVREYCTEETKEIGDGCACHIEANACEVKCCDNPLGVRKKWRRQDCIPL